MKNCESNAIVEQLKFLKARKKGSLIGIELIDHLIIGDGRFVSLKEKGVRLMEELKKEVKWFLVTLQSEFRVTVAATEVAVETTELGLEEVEDFYVPNEFFDVLPETMLYEIMVADEEKENVWGGGISFHSFIHI